MAGGYAARGDGYFLSFTYKVAIECWYREYFFNYNND